MMACKTTGFQGYGIANAVAIGDDGKILVVGLSAFYYVENYIINFAIARLNTDGTLDNTFSGDGRLVENNEESYLYEEGSRANSVAIQTDGKIIVVGSSRGMGGVRYNADGSRDMNFNGTGNAVVIQSDGKIVVGGGALSRYNSDGSFDTTFSGDGRVFMGSNVASVACKLMAR